MVASDIAKPWRSERPGRSVREREVYDLVGVGCGPANLALGVCLEEEAEAPGGRDLRRVFLEAKPHAVWHPGMLLEDSLIQISVLKDLATVRNPRSRFTFLSYLQAKGRLFEFLNLRDLFPTRIEFNDYLAWVAGELGRSVRFGRRALAVEPVAGRAGGPVELLRVVAENVATGEREELLARNLVVATGGTPRVPAGVELAPGGRVFHAQDFMLRVKRDFADRGAPYRFVVVGQGQSAAELFCYLLNHYREADVTAAIRRFAYKPVDDSDFTNEIFFPQMVDFLYDLPETKRRWVLDMCKDVNYAVVDMALIRRIYRCLYQERVLGRERARIRPFLELAGIDERPDGAVARFTDLLRDRPVEIAADAVVLATGFAWRREHPLLSELSPYLLREPTGAYRIERDYRVAAGEGFAPRIYLQGFAEPTHGASETVLSLLPIRAGDIVRSLLAAGAVEATAAAERQEKLSSGAAGGISDTLSVEGRTGPRERQLIPAERDMEQQECQQSAKEQPSWGFQLIIDCFGCDEPACCDLDRGYEFLDKVTLHLGMTKQTQPYIFKTCETAFPGKPGYSGWVPIIESGIQIHTSANNRFISIDVYSCRPFDPADVVEYVRKWFEPKRIETQFFHRGMDFRRKSFEEVPDLREAKMRTA